jgi:hypothetical protein
MTVHDRTRLNGRLFFIAPGASLGRGGRPEAKRGPKHKNAGNASKLGAARNQTAHVPYSFDEDRRFSSFPPLVN